jgi:hypothetical protein
MHKHIGQGFHMHDLSLHDRDIGYHSAIRSMTRDGSDNNILLEDGLKQRIDDSKDCHITTEYDVSWADRGAFLE